MNLTDEYRLYVQRGELDSLSRLLEEHRTVYNAALSQLKTAYEVGGERQTALGQWSYFREWRKQGGLLANASSIQQTLRRLDSYRLVCSSDARGPRSAAGSTQRPALGRR